MPRYIDADALIERLKFKRDETDINGKKHSGLECAIAQVQKQPTADVVEVVRCKDCKFWCIQDGNNPNYSYFCSVDKMWCMPARKADDFCSYGERKE